MRTEGRAKRLPRAVRERQILDAAVDVFSRLGFHAASMDEISEVAGISKPMLYAYLGSKEELFATCIRREATRMMEAIATGVGARSGTRRAAVERLAGVLRVRRRAPGELASCCTGRRRTQGGPFAVELRTCAAGPMSLVAALLAQSHEGDPATKLEAESLAAALVGAGESLADWWLDHPEEPAGVVAARLMNLVWMGFGDLVDGN